MNLIDSIIWPTILHGFEVWGYILIEFDWDKMESVYILMLYHIIKTKQTIPRAIIQAEFWVCYTKQGS